jgi:hypothetical protein
LRWSALFDSVDSTTEDWIAEQMITVNNLIMVTFVLFYLVITYWLFYSTLELDCVYQERTNFVAGLYIYD